MNAKQLRNSILQMAIQGKLVQQDPNDEPACVLLDKIRQEKKRLVKEGKLKKKDIIEVPISDVEKPFEIPHGWGWCRLNDILLLLTDGTHRTPKYVENGIPFVSVKNMSNGVLSFSNTKFITEEEHNELIKRCNPQRGDILLSKVGTTGVPSIINTDVEFSIFVSLALLKFDHKLVNCDFLIHLINSPLVQLQAKDNTRGVGNKNWVISAIAETIIILPPLAEQQRIVAKLEEILPLVDEYGKAQEEADKLQAELPDKLRKSILQEAIQGKLIPQDPNDEPASILLDKICQEKKHLVKEGKLKKKELEDIPISEDEKPFEIPDSWEWCRLGGISTYSRTKKKINAAVADKKIWGLDLEDIEKGGNLLCRKTIGERKAIGDKTYFNKGDILYSKLRPYLLKILVAPDDGICTPEIVPFTCYGSINHSYIIAVLKSIYVDDYINSVTYGIKMPRVSTETMTNLLIPLPPLEEQKRIVSKIEQLFQELGR